MTLTNHALDNFVAPCMSELVECRARSLEHWPPRSTEWISDFILNSIFRIRFVEPQRRYVLYFLRKVQGAVREYEAGRVGVVAYLTSGRRSASLYFAALDHFEAAVSVIDQSYCLAKSIARIKHHFQKGKNSALERLREIYNMIKHAEGKIAKGQVPKGMSVPVWLENDGLATAKAKVTFDEMVAMVGELATLADGMASPKLDATHEADDGPSQSVDA